MSTLFHHVTLPKQITLGATVIPTYRTEITETGSGFEYRNTPWKRGKLQYQLAKGPHAISDLKKLKNFFDARQGKLHGFLWRDWLDYQSTTTQTTITQNDQPLIALDKSGKKFQLQKIYNIGTINYSRIILKPVQQTVKIAKNNTLLSPQNDYSINSETGQITLTQAINTGDTLTAGFEYYVPVRFDNDSIEIQKISEHAGYINQITLTEIKIPITNTTN